MAGGQDKMAMDRAEYNRMRKEIERLQDAVDSLQLDLTDIERLLDLERADNERLQAENSTLRGNRAVDKCTIENLRAKCNQRRDDLAQAREILDERFMKIERLQAAIEGLRQNRDLAYETERRLRTALEKSNNMIVEFIQMADQPLEYRLNTVKRAQVLLDAIAREALNKGEVSED